MDFGSSAIGALTSINAFHYSLSFLLKIFLHLAEIPPNTMRHHM